MKERVDKKVNVRPHTIQVGDNVLLKQKSTKQNPVYDPKPFTVTGVWGTQIKGTREGTTKTRDAQRWKLVKTKQRTQYGTPKEETSTYQSDPDIGPSSHQASHQHHRRHTQQGLQQSPRTLEPDQTSWFPTSPTQTPRAQSYEGGAQAAGGYRATLMRQLHNHPEVIMSSTIANRPKRQRSKPDRYKPYMD